MKMCGGRHVAMGLAMEAWHVQTADDRLSRYLSDMRGDGHTRNGMKMSAI